MSASPLFERTDFTGSFTDNLYTNDPQLCAQNDNLLIDNNRKPFVRDGSALMYTGTPAPLAATGRVSRVFTNKAETALLGFANGSLWEDTGSTFTEISSPAHVAFGQYTASTHKVSYTEWRGHLLLASNAGGKPVKVYRNSADTAWLLRTAGLPAPVAAYSPSQATILNNCIALSTALRTAMLAHFADVTDHAGGTNTTHRAADSISGAGIGAVATTLPTLLTLTGQLLTAYNLHYLDQVSALSYHRPDLSVADLLEMEAITGAEFAPPASTAEDSALESLAIPTTLLEAATRLNDLKVKYNTHRGKTDSHGVFNANISYNGVTTSAVLSSALGPEMHLDLSALYAYMNRLKAVYNLHIADGASGNPYSHNAVDAAHIVTAADATTPETLSDLMWQFGQKYDLHDDDTYLPAAWAYHRAVTTIDHTLTPNDWGGTFTGNEGFPDWNGGVPAGAWANTVARLNMLRTAYNSHVNDTITHLAGSASLVNPYLSLGTDLVLASYVYAFVHSYTYTTASGEVFEDVSAPLLATPETQVLATSYQPLLISNIPTLANDTYSNYDASNIVIKIYRTTDNGTTFYYVGQVANGTTTFTDSALDDDLIATNNKLYITGGVVDNDPPPVSRFVHVVGEKAYYGYCTDSGEVIKNRVRESLANDIDSCPSDFYVDIDDSEVTGISSCKSVPIVFGKRSFHRLEGGFDELGRGSLQAISLSDSIGCVSENSIVRTEAGVFFAGTDGFYWTDGYTYKKLSSDWNATYQTLVSTETRQLRINGAFDPVTKRIWWGAQSAAGSDCDTCYILDLNFSFEPHPTWTTASNPSHFNPTALAFKAGVMYRGDSAGYLFKHTSALTDDAYIDPGLAGSSWSDTPILYNWTDVCRDFGLNSVRKWVTWMVMNFRKESNVNLMPWSRNDDTSAWQPMGKIQHLNSWVWGDPLPIWGTNEYLWNYQRGLLERKRRFPANQVRCTYKQIRLANQQITLKTYSEMGTATVNSGAKTATLDDLTKSWPTNCVGQYLYLPDVGYRIRRRVSATVLLLETAPASATYNWLLSGYGKAQDLSLLGLTLYGSPQSVTSQASRSP